MIKHDNVYLTPIELEDIELLNKWKMMKMFISI